MKTALVIDNSAAMTKEDLIKTKVAKVVPISFIVNGEEYYEGVNMSYEEFHQFLSDKKTDVSTSQPSVEFVKEAWREVLKEYDEIVYILLSSGLSAACNSAINASHEEEFEGKVFVVNNQRVSYMNKIAFYEAAKMIEDGKPAEEIKAYLEETKGECGAYLVLDTLKFLKKGGRITPAAAAIGTLLNIKPVLQLHGGKLDAYAKCLSYKQGKQKIMQALRKEIVERFPQELADGKVWISIAHTNPDLNSDELKEFKKEIIDNFPDMKFMVMDPLPLFVACHTGPKTMAIGYGVDRLGCFENIVK